MELLQLSTYSKATVLKSKYMYFNGMVYCNKIVSLLRSEYCNCTMKPSYNIQLATTDRNRCYGQINCFIKIKIIFYLYQSTEMWCLLNFATSSVHLTVPERPLINDRRCAGRTSDNYTLLNSLFCSHSNNSDIKYTVFIQSCSYIWSPSSLWVNSLLLLNTVYYYC